MVQNSIQYFHQTNDAWVSPMVTAALEVPTKDEILSTSGLQSSPNITMKLGISKVHPNDNYNRKTGRKVSSTRLTPIDFILTKIEFDGFGRHVYRFDSMEGKHIVFLRLNSKSDKPHFIQYNNVEI
jgi:hypothetical protein